MISETGDLVRINTVLREVGLRQDAKGENHSIKRSVG